MWVKAGGFGEEGGRDVGWVVFLSFYFFKKKFEKKEIDHFTFFFPPEQC